MAENTHRSGKHSKQTLDKTFTTLPDDTGDVPKTSAPANRTTSPSPPPKTVKGQRYVAPAGRHSQQTHRRAQESAAAEGHATEKEQHDHDRSVVQAQLNQHTEQQLSQQREQSERTAARKGKAKEDLQASKPE